MEGNTEASFLSISCEVSSMKMITVAGAHACGKTSVILKTAELLLKENCRPGVMKLDCISSEDDRIYSAAGITNVKYISGNICPDHYFADSISDIFQWGLKEKLDLLITESAGLCGRCSPHIRDIPAVCVIDCLSGITAPQKIGPMLRYADFIAVTKGKIVLISTHDPILALSCEKRIFIENGGIRGIVTRTATEEKLLKELQAQEERMKEIRNQIRGGKNIG